MPGFEVFGKEEQAAINDIFEQNGGIMFAHGFDQIRNGVYRVREFEKAFAQKIGASYAQAVSSGSTAIKVGLKALGVGPGDEVITTAFTFVATVEAILEVGATPIIVDINETLNIDPPAIENAITKNTKAIIVVHMMGAPAQMDEIINIANTHKLLVIEDNAQCCGGTYKGKSLGTIGQIGTFSFDGGKTITTGEGGMVVCHDQNTFRRARAYHDHGHEYNPDMGRGQEGALMPGFNYRMMEIQGAIGLAQLAKLDDINKMQKKNKHRLKNLIKNLPVEFRKISDPKGEIGDSLIFYLDSKERANSFVHEMGIKGLGTKNLPDAIKWHFAQHWSHMYMEYGFYQDTYRKEWSKSESILSRAVALPIMVKMTDERIEQVASDLKTISKKVFS